MNAIKTGEIPRNDESKIKHVTHKLDAIYSRNAFPFLSAILPPFLPSKAEAIAAGTIAKPTKPGVSLWTSDNKMGLT